MRHGITERKELALRLDKVKVALENYPWSVTESPLWFLGSQWKRVFHRWSLTCSSQFQCAWLVTPSTASFWWSQGKLWEGCKHMEYQVLSISNCLITIIKQFDLSLLQFPMCKREIPHLLLKWCWENEFVHFSEALRYHLVMNTTETRTSTLIINFVFREGFEHCAVSKAWGYMLNWEEKLI